MKWHQNSRDNPGKTTTDLCPSSGGTTRQDSHKAHTFIIPNKLQMRAAVNCRPHYIDSAIADRIEKHKNGSLFHNTPPLCDFCRPVDFHKPTMPNSTTNLQFISLLLKKLFDLPFFRFPLQMHGTWNTIRTSSADKFSAKLIIYL